MSLRRGDVCWATFEPRSGSEQRGRRPAVVVSRDAFNSLETWRSITVVPVSTSASQRRRGPTAVEIPAGEGGLTELSLALCHQVTTLDRGKLEPPVGRLSETLLRQVEAGLKAAMQLG